MKSEDRFLSRVGAGLPGSRGAFGSPGRRSLSHCCRCFNGLGQPCGLRACLPGFPKVLVAASCSLVFRSVTPRRPEGKESPKEGNFQSKFWMLPEGPWRWLPPPASSRRVQPRKMAGVISSPGKERRTWRYSEKTPIFSVSVL